MLLYQKKIKIKNKLPKPGLLYAVRQGRDKIRFDHILLDNKTKIFR